jgi:excisionase family DNA binding protein
MPTKKSCRMFHNSEETRDTPRLLYDRKEAARQLSLSVRSLDYLVANKKLEFRRIGKKVLITHARLVRFSQANPAKKVRLRKEAEGRKRYYSQEEYQRLLHAVGQRFPEHSAELIVSVHSGMRLSGTVHMRMVAGLSRQARDQTDENQERLPPNSSTEC